MLTKIAFKNFKRFGEAEIDLGQNVVFIGPNNSGKTTALQALALWSVGLRKWLEKRGSGPAPKKRPGVTINRNDLIALPIPSAKQIWKDLHVRDTEVVEGKPKTENVRIEIVVEGVTEAATWVCGLEFDFANEESVYCRPIKDADGNYPPIPEAATRYRIAYLPPMSGLATREDILQQGSIYVRIGEGRTAEVLRNLCHHVIQQPDGSAIWERITEVIHRQFGARILKPDYREERGEITMAYEERGIVMDLSNSGRGLQQTLLLLAYLNLNPDSVLLLDEPDAHLEILRQREIYNLLCESAEEKGSQIIAASHSEVVLREAADRHVVTAFVGKPHRIDSRGAIDQVRKALVEIGYEAYYQAEVRGWVLYAEGSTDLAILKSLAHTLEHPVAPLLESPFFFPVGTNVPALARNHFFGLKEAFPSLVGIAVFDRLEKALNDHGGLVERMWSRREIENYICRREVLMRWVQTAHTRHIGGESPLLAVEWEQVMADSIQEMESALSTLGKGDPWGPDLKVSDEFLSPLFEVFFKKLKLPNIMRKTNFHVLAPLLKKEEIDPEVSQILDEVQRVAQSAKPTT